MFYLFSSQAHNRNLLSIDFDQSTRVGKIYDDHRKFTLHIQYDSLGRPVVWSPSSKYTEVNISYSGGGLLSAIHRGEWSERLEYENDRVVSRAWVNGKIWSYTYADRVSGVLLEKVFKQDVMASFSLYWGLFDSFTPACFASAVSRNLINTLLCLPLQRYDSYLELKVKLVWSLKVCEMNFEDEI